MGIGTDVVMESAGALYPIFGLLLSLVFASAAMTFRLGLGHPGYLAPP